MVNITEETFTHWVTHKIHFWVLSIGWALWASTEDIAMGNIRLVLETIIYWTSTVVIFYLIYFEIKQGVYRKIEREVGKRKKK